MREVAMSIESASQEDVGTHRGLSETRSYHRYLRPYANVGGNGSNNED